MNVTILRRLLKCTRQTQRNRLDNLNHALQYPMIQIQLTISRIPVDNTELLVRNFWIHLQNQYSPFTYHPYGWWLGCDGQLFSAYFLGSRSPGYFYVLAESYRVLLHPRRVLLHPRTYSSKVPLTFGTGNQILKSKSKGQKCGFLPKEMVHFVLLTKQFIHINCKSIKTSILNINNSSFLGSLILETFAQPQGKYNFTLRVMEWENAK